MSAMSGSDSAMRMYSLMANGQNFEDAFENIYEISWNDAKPIFIIGVPRCGSTVVEKVIASGPKSISVGEECSIINTFIGNKILKKEGVPI